ncbi:signal recognition particle subunit FFH/SRP54 (srp54) [Polaribacter sp. KT25b]|uniref:AAA family ATPase n=1 Tax=Polaribacter sp. KT25b TaxID=1855336 RepID=UPI00087C4EC2|nr:AAA family ATPase [Polaribacter sp. KT25b]SDS18199.1 signal recognition particle subunit FFH/SRP54 (srp54) [Polaribacter sp. KT25b]
MQLQKAQRHQVKLRLGLSGASGFGKSYSALLLAYGITEDWTKIAVVDTENNSASLYSHLGDFNVVSLNQPYSPERYIEAIKLCEENQMDVIIIDSITHEWNGKGGCLQIHEQLGGRFQDWAKLTPRHQAFIDAILQSNCHVITTVRKKMDYSMDRDSSGKTRVVKHGLKDITREGFSYELTVDFEIINENHMAKATKDRTGLFMDKPEILITKGVGRMLIDWCNQGVSIADAKKEIAECTTVKGLRHLYQKYLPLKKELHDTILNRKQEIESVKSMVVERKEIIHNNKISENGTRS